MHISSVVLVLFLTLVCGHAYAQDNQYWHVLSGSVKTTVRVVKDPGNCLYGIQDSTGNWTQPPVYGAIDRQSSGFLLVLGDSMGFANLNGEMILPVIYQNIRVLHGFYHQEYSEDNQIIYSSNIHVSKQTDLLVISQDNLQGIATSSGDILLEPQYDRIDNLLDEFVLIYHQGNYGLLDSNFAVVVAPTGNIIQFGPAPGYFSQEVVTDTGNYYQLINGEGEKVFSQLFRVIPIGSCNGAFFAADANSKFSIYHLNGKVLFKADKIWDYGYAAENRPFVLNGRHGIVGPEGNLVVEARFDTILRPEKYTNNSMVKCYRKGLAGVIDMGKGVLIEPQYIDMQLSVNSKDTLPLYYFLAQTEKGWGVIDEHGKIMVPHQYPKAFMHNQSNKFQYNTLYLLDDQTLVAYQPAPFRQVPLSKVLYGIRKSFLMFSFDRGLSGLVDSTGKVVLPPEYHILVQDSGYAVYDPSDQSTLIAYYNADGSMRDLDAPYLEVLSETDWGRVVKSADGWLGLYSYDDKEIVPCRYFALAFDDSFYWGQVRNDMWGDGNRFIEDQSEGLAYIPESEFWPGKWLLYDFNGKQVMTDTFSMPSEFVDGRAIVRLQDGKEGVLSSSLHWIVPPQYDYIREEEGLYMLTKQTDGTAHYLNPFYEVPEDTARLLGLVRSNGSTLVPIQYEAIGPPSYGYIPVWVNGELGVYDTSGQQILPPDSEAFHTTDLTPIDFLNDYHVKQKLDSIEDTELKAFTGNMLWYYSLLHSLYQYAGDVDGPFTSHINVPNAMYFPFAFWEGPWGTYCDHEYSGYSSIESYSPISISFSTTYSSCEYCTRSTLMPCQREQELTSFFVTKKGVEPRSFSDQYKISQGQLIQLLNGVKSESIMVTDACEDISAYVDNPDNTTVFSEEGVVFYLDVSGSSFDMNEEIEGFDFGESEYGILKLILSYELLSPYLIKGSEIHKWLKNR